MTIITKRDSTIIKGFAILLMIVHHVWNPIFIKGISNIPDTTSTYWLLDNISNYSKICVSIFAFLSGWAFWEVKNKFISYRYSVNKCIHFLISYWVVALIFIIIGILTSDNLPTFKIAILNLFGFEVGAKETMHYDYVNVVFAWYVRFYLAVLLTIPIILKIIDKVNIILIFFVIYVLCVLTQNSELFLIKKWVHVYFQWLPCIVIGIYCNRNNWLEKMNNNKITIFILILLLLLRHFKTELYGGMPIDFIIVVFLILYLKKLCDYISPLQYINKTFILLGTLSMNIWYCHSIFFLPSHKWSWLIGNFQNCFVTLFSTIILSILFALLCNYIQKLIINKFH